MIKLIITVTLFCSFANAIDSNKCSKLLNEGWYKTYKWGGVGESVYNAMTQESKRAGTSTATSNISTEGTTAISDPGYYTNISTSETQSTSSWGECSLFAMKTMQKQQELYFAQNELGVKRQIALNQDNHLTVLATFNLCDDKVYDKFKNKVRENMPVLIESKNGSEFVREIKKMIGNDADLKEACYPEYLS